MGLLICTATAAELAALAPAIFPSEKTVMEMRPARHAYRGKNATFLATGTGPLNAALAIGWCLGEAANRQDPIETIICAGLAGAFDLERNPLCGIWRISEEIWPEYGLNDGAQVTAKAFSHPLWARPDGDDVYDRIPLSDVADVFPGAGKAIAWPQCQSLTVAGASASFNRREALWSRYRADLENMEGFAAAYAAARWKIPCIEVRVVSHKTGPRSREEKNMKGALKKLELVLPALL